MRKIVLSAATVAMGLSLAVGAGIGPASACTTKHVGDGDKYVDGSPCNNTVLRTVNSVPTSSATYSIQYYTGTQWKTGSGGSQLLQDGSRSWVADSNGHTNNRTVQLVVNRNAAADIEF